MLTCQFLHCWYRDRLEIPRSAIFITKLFIIKYRFCMFYSAFLVWWAFCFLILVLAVLFHLWGIWESVFLSLILLELEFTNNSVHSSLPSYFTFTVNLLS
jgi:hypothetical protein